MGSWVKRTKNVRALTSTLFSKTLFLAIKYKKTGLIFWYSKNFQISCAFLDTIKQSADLEMIGVKHITIRADSNKFSAFYVCFIY